MPNSAAAFTFVVSAAKCRATSRCTPWRKFSRKPDSDDLFLVRHANERTGIDALRRTTDAIMGRPDSRPGFGAISMPTLVLVGEEDVITPVAEAQEMAAGIGTRANLVVVPGCGHLSTLEAPEAVTQELLAWMG